MPLSSGPYNNNPIPVVSIQDIRFNTNELGEYVVEISVSNEKIVQEGRSQKTVRFGNFIYFTDNLSEINSLSSGPQNIVNLMRSSTKGKFGLALSGRNYKHKTQASQGQRVYSHLNTQTFTVPASANLFVLVCSYVEKNNSFILGNIAKEIIVSQGLTPIDATVYTLDETVTSYGDAGTVWPGSIHAHNNRFMAGNAHVAVEHPNVTATTVPNVRLKDLRVIRAANSLQYTFSELPRVYFSPVTLSRNATGVINGSFTFNLLNFAKNNCRYGGLIADADALLSCLAIKDINILQKISSPNTKGNALTAGKSDACGLAAANPFKRVANLNNGCYTVQEGVIDNPALIQVFFNDETIIDANTGAAEYKVEIIFDDRSPQLLSRLLNPLRRKLKKLSAKATPQPGAQKMYNSIVMDYITAVRAIFGTAPFQTFTQRFWIKNLQALVNRFNPNFGSDEKLFITTLNNFVSVIDSIMAATNVKKTATTQDLNSTIYRSDRDTVLRVVRQFVDKFTLTGTKNYGLNYVDDLISPSPLAIPSISFEEYQNRTQKELIKYDVTNTQAASLNTMGYLSAETVNLTPNPLSISVANLNVPTSRALPLIKSNVQKQSTVLNVNKKEKPAATSRSILSSLNINVRKNPVPAKKLTRFNPRMVRDIIDSAEYLSETSNFVYETSPSSPSSGSTKSTVIKKSDKAVFESPLVVNLIDKSITRFEPVTKIANPQGIQGSPALQKFNEDPSVLLTGSGFSNAVNFNSVAQVQYLDAYNTNQGVAKQNWTLLTPQKMESAMASTTPLLCKLVKVSNALGTPDVLTVEPMASMFVLGAPKVNPATAQPQNIINSTKANIAKEQQKLNVSSDNVTILYAKNDPYLSVTTSTMATQAAPAQAPSNLAQFLVTTSTPTAGY